MQQNQKHINSYIQTWLFCLASLIVGMIVLGGYTRLSGSGLSMTRWEPISGIIPPLNQKAWQKEFDKYKQYPEYKVARKDMNLPEFKFIYFIEFFHRILARFTGLVMLLPLIFFYQKGYISEFDQKKYIAIVLLFLIQGFMGWYMVKSGLIHNPYVSHYRLAVHLILAMLLYSFIIWQMIEPAKNHISYSLRKLLIVLLILNYIQIFVGGLVAGLKAGMIYNTFPLMGTSFIPPEVDIANTNDPASVQFIHRIFAYIITVLAVYISYLLKRHNWLAKSLILVVSAQFILGVLNILYIIPISLALLHQLVAVFVITVNIYILRKVT